MSNEVLPVSLNQVKAHIRELRKAKAGWVEILQMSNYHNVEALQGLTNVVNKIEVLKSLFPGELLFAPEPSMEDIGVGKYFPTEY